LGILNVVDEYTRRCLACRVDRSIKSRDLLGVLAELFERHGRPAAIRLRQRPRVHFRRARQLVEGPRCGAAELSGFSKYKLAKAYVRWTRDNDASALTEQERADWRTLVEIVNKAVR
jgi:hypothetical protein